MKTGTIVNGIRQRVDGTLRMLEQARATGLLRIESAHGQVQIGLDRGRIVFARGRGIPKLGEALLASGALSASSLDAALALQSRKSSREPLGRLLFSLQLVDEDVIAEALADQFDLALEACDELPNPTLRFEPQESHGTDAP